MTTAIVGRIGSGKTFTAKGLVEAELAAGARVCVIDPTGAWWGLRLRPDGAAPAFPVVIFGGAHGDVPIIAAQGEQLADVVVDGRAAQSVIDISEMSGGEQTRFLTAFFERLYTRNRTPLTLVMDEADVMAPQNPLPEQRRLQGAVNKIVRRGRINGFRPIMITQRPAVLDKSVLSQIQTLIAMQLTSPQDRKAIEAWVQGNADAGQAREVLDSLASLPRGEGWLWTPHEGVLERRAFPAIATFDSSRTPERGEAIREVAPLTLADIDGLRAAFSPEILSSSNDAKKTGAGDAALRAEIARLGREMIEAEARGFAKGIAEGRRGTVALLRDRLPELLAELDGQHMFDEVPVVHMAPAEAPMTPKTASAIGDVIRAASREIKAKRSPAPDAGALNSAARKMLAVLDTKPPVRRSWTQVATLAGLRARGGHFNAGRKALIDSGLIVDSGGLIAIMKPSGAARAETSDPIALVEMWATSLSGAAPKILRYLFSQADGARSRDSIAHNLSMQPRGGHWNAAWKELRDNGIVTVDGGVAQLTELFRPAGRGK